MKNPKKPIKETFSGFSYPLRALRLLGQNPRLLLYVLFPIGVNILLGAALYAGIFIPAWSSLQELLADYSAWHQAWIEQLPGWLGFLSFFAVLLAWVLRILLIGGLFFVLGFLLVQFGTILGAPWYGRLSEKVEETVSGSVTGIEVGFLRDIARALAFEGMKLLLMAGTAVLGLFLQLIPALGTLLAGVISLFLAILLVCLDFLDPPLERLRLPFFQKVRTVFRHLPGSAAFGIVVFFMISIPVVNFITIPLSTAGGTLFYCDRIRHPGDPESEGTTEENSQEDSKED